MEFVKRKTNRLKDYDYSQNGAYFITICVQDKRPILSRIVGGTAATCPIEVELSMVGRIVNKAIQAIPNHYPNVTVDKYVIMPNHVHMLRMVNCDDGQEIAAPTDVSEVIRQMKGHITKQCGRGFWQKS